VLDVRIPAAIGFINGGGPSVPTAKLGTDGTFPVPPR